MGSAALPRAMLAAACLCSLLVFADVASPQQRRAVDERTWQGLTDSGSVTITRGAAGGPITSIQIELSAPCDDGASGAYMAPSLSGVPVAADGGFSYEGPDRNGTGDSHLQITGRFSG